MLMLNRSRFSPVYLTQDMPFLFLFPLPSDPKMQDPKRSDPNAGSSYRYTFRLAKRLVVPMQSCSTMQRSMMAEWMELANADYPTCKKG